MKKIILLNIIILFTSVQLINAQKIKHKNTERLVNLPNFDKKKLHFGFYLGLNNNNFKISYYDQSGLDRSAPINPYPTKDLFVEVDAAFGFNLGFIASYKLHKNISLRFEPGLVSNTKTLTFIDPNLSATNAFGNPAYTGTVNSVREVSGTYMHIPLLLKFSTNRLHNFRPYVIGGVAYDYNFSSNEGNGDDNYEGEFRMKTHNFMYEVGIGVDFYFNFFKFSPSIRGVFALNNELVNDNDHNPPYTSPWTGPIDYLGTRGIFLNLTFH